MLIIPGREVDVILLSHFKRLAYSLRVSHINLRSILHLHLLCASLVLQTSKNLQHVLLLNFIIITYILIFN